MTNAPHQHSFAFYLQFHPILQNDEWRRPGFAEWGDAAGAPAPCGHCQLHAPGAPRFFNLRLATTKRRRRPSKQRMASTFSGVITTLFSGGSRPHRQQALPWARWHDRHSRTPATSRPHGRGNMDASTLSALCAGESRSLWHMRCRGSYVSALALKPPLRAAC
ncbi:glycoside hydrolase family 99-like domain-containing protein [Fodinibacter luteus]|uniref:glycoside hydrolase family 99-like domain-containing protein n=1 Tax=Fodinibacter luteus TaxID=552064 RepID=UPI003CCC4A12